MKKFDINFYNNPTGNKKEWSHKYTETWDKSKYYCPKCRGNNVWYEKSGGDYDVGEKYICISCNSYFYLPDGVSNTNNEQDIQRLDYLKKEI